MTEVWYCAVTNMLDDYSCRVHYQAGIREPVHESCGPRRLVPFDALVLVRDVDGNWPEWIYDAWPDCPDEGHISQGLVLDTLAVAAKENPQ